MNQEILLSIIIPTYNRSAGLQMILKSIAVQKTDWPAVEILVVNNSPELKTKCEEICDRFIHEGLPIQLFHQPLPGVSQARNLGIEKAKGKWLAFFDDDEELVENYLNNLLSFLAKEPALTQLGGPRFPIFDCNPPGWVKESYFTISYGDNPRRLSNREYLPGGNFVIAKKIVDQIGGFRTDFGHKAKQRGYGEDTEFMDRAIKCGGKQDYYPSLIIYHHIPEDRVNLPWFKRQKYLSAMAKARLYLQANPLPEERLNLIKINVQYFIASMKGFCQMFYVICGEPFRNRLLLQSHANYWIERVASYYVRFHINIELFQLSKTRK